MRSSFLRCGFAALLLLSSAGLARAQANLYELNVHAGSFTYDLGFGDNDNSDDDVLLGGRFLLTPNGTWGFGGNFDWVNVDRIPTIGGDDIGVDMYLYSGELNYTLPMRGQTKFFLAGGLGGRTLKVEDESETRLTTPLGGGLKWLSDPAVPSWGIRGDIRDHIVHGDESEGEDNIQNNWEFSGGVSFFF
jgi:hypothetical protein